ETGDSGRTLLRIDRRENQKKIGHRGIGDEGFGAGQNIPVPFSFGRRLKAVSVRAGLRLGQTVGADRLSAAELRQVFLLLRFGAEEEDRNFTGPHMRIDRKEESLIFAAV